MGELAQATLFPSAQKHDPGGKVLLRIPAHWKSSAVFSPCERYRYELSRIWNDVERPRLVLWLMMNPSVADLEITDPTVAKCCRLSQRWGYDGVLIGNICAYRATDKQNLPASIQDGTGPENMSHLLQMAQRGSLIVVAHGIFHTRQYNEHAAAVCKVIHSHGYRLNILRLSKSGVPCHPLYLPEDLAPTNWEPKRA